MSPRILLVDDDARFLELLQRGMLRQFKVSTALSGDIALEMIANEGPFALVVADMHMPGMSGLEFLRRVQKQAPDTIRMMLTGSPDQKTALDAVNDGQVFRFLSKPSSADALIAAMEAGLERFRTQRAERDLLANTLGGALKVLTEILSMQDPATFERGQRLRESVREFAIATGFPITWDIEIASTLLSLGRVTIPATVLEKVRRREMLTIAESELIQQIPEFGARLLQSIPRLESVVAIIRCHQKRFDGTGYPAHKMEGLEIPLGARLLKIFSDLVELEAAGQTPLMARRTLRTRAGWYDPELLTSVDQFWASRAGASSTLEEVNIHQLCPGDVLVEDLVDGDGLRLLAASTLLTPMLIVKLRNFEKLHSIQRSILVHR